jgi:hypothetical protein
VLELLPSFSVLCDMLPKGASLWDRRVRSMFEIHDQSTHAALANTNTPLSQHAHPLPHVQATTLSSFAVVHHSSHSSMKPSASSHPTFTFADVEFSSILFYVQQTAPPTLHASHTPPHPACSHIRQQYCDHHYHKKEVQVAARGR